MDRDEIIKFYKFKHSTDPGFSHGSAVMKHFPRIAQFVQDFGYESILDYGCGKANLWNWRNAKTCMGWDLRRTPLAGVYLYDPAIDEYSVLPKGRFDMVVCTDVLEHVLEEDVDSTLDRLFDFTRKMLYLNISTIPASKRFPDGTNLHVTVKPPIWWKRKVKEAEKRHAERNKCYCSVYVALDVKED